MTEEKRPTLDDFDFSNVEINPPPRTENKALVLLRKVEGAGVALWQSDENSTPEILLPRDKPYGLGGYSWGYKGGGCKNLAFAMASVMYEFDMMDSAQINEKAYQLVDVVISKLHPEQEYGLSVAAMRKMLGDHELPLMERTQL